MADEVATDVRDGVAWVTLNRPDRLNAMNAALMDGLVLHLQAAADDPEVRCVVLSGKGKSFCAGGDVAMMTDKERGRADQLDVGPRIDSQVRDLDRRFASVRLLVEMAKPTIAMVRGWALGGGLCLALACDLRFVAADARLGSGFLTRAISGNFGLTYLLANTIGPARAKEFAFLHEHVSADEALAMGLIHVVKGPDELERYTEQAAGRIAAGPTFAYGKFKESLNLVVGADLARVMHYEALNSRLTSLSSDARESSAALRDKRPPGFIGG